MDEYGIGTDCQYKQIQIECENNCFMVVLDKILHYLTKINANIFYRHDYYL